ncbi:hypothetical protein [Amycolatopsis acididurans]|uniref:hypothetical protein n=1 Tax=Amycolatopsis acididurans TaxID=2724524 RepID=UPI001B31EF42|nr:hypothetical protein [Amycolatopsis acididurans]
MRASGGWLFDRVMAGWDVLALVGDYLVNDARPLHILGARAVELDAAMTSPIRGPRPHAIAVDAALFDADRRVRKLVTRSIDEGLTEVLLWGERCPEELDGGMPSLEHRLSVAARAFKTQALAAAAAPVDELDGTEVFHSGEVVPNPPGTPDLIPAA